MMERICELVTDSHIEEDFKKFIEHMGEHVGPTNYQLVELENAF